jgi:hypothetical protein
MLPLLSLIILAQAAPSAPPAPTPTASPAPLVSVAPEFAFYYFHTNGADGAADLSDALLNFNVNAGKLHSNATVGTYSFPVVGFAFAPDNAAGANVMLYSPLPIAALTYQFDSHLSLVTGKFGSLLGQESPFTYQNLNIQRGIGWNMEPAISRGVQVGYTNGPWSATLRDDDAYYSGSGRAFEGLIGWSPSANTSLQFAAIIPSTNLAPNATVTVGNKSEYDLMYTRTVGKLQLLPYVLWVHSPASSILGYTKGENATAAVLLGNWSFSPQWSAAFRYEGARNDSNAADNSPNADLVGFGPGSSAASQTLTPTYHFANGGVLRFEYSHVSATGMTQTRYGLDFGVMH